VGEIDHDRLECTAGVAFRQTREDTGGVQGGSGNERKRGCCGPPGSWTVCPRQTVEEEKE
jgi:hypothetical protein